MNGFLAKARPVRALTISKIHCTVAADRGGFKDRESTYSHRSRNSVQQ